MNTRPVDERGGVGLAALNLAAFLLNMAEACLSVAVHHYYLLPVNIGFGLVSLLVAIWAVTI